MTPECPVGISQCVLTRGKYQERTTGPKVPGVDVLMKSGTGPSTLSGKARWCLWALSIHEGIPLDEGMVMFMVPDGLTRAVPATDGVLEEGKWSTEPTDPDPKLERWLLLKRN